MQLAGVWPTGDFRLWPDDLTATYVLIAVVLFAAVVGIAVAVARHAWQIGLYAASTLLAAVAFGLLGSPWLAGKAFAIASPVIVFSAVVGCSALVAREARRGVRRPAAVALGVLWSNSLAYREVNLAPRAQLAELERIGNDFAGGGPALMTEYQPYGVRHFLRRLDAEGASELRRRPVALRDGSTLAKGRFADLSAFRPADLHEYRTLVLRRSPVVSRPPSAYRPPGPALLRGLAARRCGCGRRVPALLGWSNAASHPARPGRCACGSARALRDLGRRLVPRQAFDACGWPRDRLGTASAELRGPVRLTRRGRAGAWRTHGRAPQTQPCSRSRLRRAGGPIGPLVLSPRER